MIVARSLRKIFNINLISIIFLSYTTAIFAQAATLENQLEKISVAILLALDQKKIEDTPLLTSEHEATLTLGLLAYDALQKIDHSDATLGTEQEIVALQKRLVDELYSYAAKYAPTFLTKIPAIAGQDETVAGNLANWGTTTIETGLVINNNNGGTVAGPALQIASFATNQALLVTTTAGLNILQISTNPNQPALSIANSNGVFATPVTGTLLSVNGSFAANGSSNIIGNTYMSAANGVVLTVTGNATSPSTVLVGNSSVTSPALQLIGNPPATGSDFILTIDSAGNVKQSATTTTFGNIIYNGGQTGPLTIGTSNASSLSLITNSSPSIAIDASQNVGIGTTTPITQLTVIQNTPKLFGSASTLTAPYGIYVQGRYAYVTNTGANTLQIFDISNPAAPQLINGTGTATGSTPQGISVQGRYAYITNSPTAAAGSLQVFDISNPAIPILMSTYTIAAGNIPYNLYVQGRYVYVVYLGSNLLQVFDAYNPTAPVPVGSTAVGSEPINLYVQGRYAYVVNVNGQFSIVDVSNPAVPVLGGTLATGSTLSSIYVQGRYAYVTNYTAATLQIYDIYNPMSAPIVVGSAPAGTQASNVVVQGRYAYVTNYSANTFQVFNVSNPAAPVQVGTNITTGTHPTTLFIVGRYAYITNNGSAATGLQVFDLGGAYIQQLEAGGIEVGTLQTRENMTVNNDLDVKGGMNIGRTLNINGNMSVNGNSTITNGETITSGTLNILNGNIVLPVVNSAGTQGLLEVGGANTNTNVSLYSFGTRNLFLGNGPINADITMGSDNITIGTNASNTLSGLNNTVAIGNTAQSSASTTVALGYNAAAQQLNAVAVGQGSRGANQSAAALGDTATADGFASVAIGLNTMAANNYSVALGNGAQANADSSVAIGNGAVASQANAIILGNSSANAVAVGIGTNTPAAKLHVVNVGATPAIEATAVSGQNSIITSAGTVSVPAYSFTGNSATGLYSPATNQLALVATNTARLILDATGSISSYSRYRVHAYASGTAQTIGAGANALINFPSESFDTNNNFVTTTYTAPISGYYLVGATVSFTNAGAGGAQTGIRQLDLMVNGVAQTGYSATIGVFSTGGVDTVQNTQVIQFAVNDIIALTAGHTLSVRYTNNAANTDTIQITGTKFNIHLLSLA